MSSVVGRVVAPLVNTNEPESLVIEVCVSPGDVVAQGDVLCVLETSKSTEDVEADRAGHVGPLRVATGDMVEAGALICEIWDGPPPAEDPVAVGAGGVAPRLTRKAQAMIAQAGITDLSSLPTDRFVTQRDVEDLIARHASDAPVALDPDVVERIGPDSIVVFGGGGLGRSVIDVIRAAGTHRVVAVVDDRLAAGTDVLGVPVVGGAATLGPLADAGLRNVAHAVGGIGRMSVRTTVAERIAQAGLGMPVLVDPSATVSPSAVLGDGSQVHPGAHVQAGSVMGRNVLVNTGVVVAHDCRVGDHVHLAPGAILAGDVTVGDGTLVGMGVTLLLGVTVGAGCVIGNGAHVLADVPDGTRVAVGTVWTGSEASDG